VLESGKYSAERRGFSVFTEEPLMGVPQFVGEATWTRLLRQKILQVAAFSSNVLITGPSGTGKELISRAIHEHSSRRAGPFIPVDCTALSGELFASHLFGHVKGAFTGAEHPRLGCFRVADSGTILLDEIGELSPEMQAKLLRTIQERMVVPLGSDDPIPIDVRIIAATNRNLLSEVQAGRFRLDLYYRLNVVSFETISLRERPEDIGALAAHFLTRLTIENGFPRKRLSSAALAALMAYSWPGNVRELQNVLERAAIFAPGEEIEPEAIPSDISTAGLLSAVPPRSGEVEASSTHWPSLADIERQHIHATLQHVFYNQSQAAEMLKINRASLARKIKRYGVIAPQGRRGRPSKIHSDPPI
jgi:DNA-binding NtrC family response regulator